MKRLLFLPVLFAAGCVYGYWTGYAWPVLTTARSLLRPEPCNEADWC